MLNITSTQRCKGIYNPRISTKISQRINQRKISLWNVSFGSSEKITGKMAVQQHLSPIGMVLRCLKLDTLPDRTHTCVCSIQMYLQNQLSTMLFQCSIWDVK